MKKLLIGIAIIALLAWVVSWFRAPEVVATSGARPWPGGMGTLDSVEGRYPRVQANDASRKLTALANALPKNEVVEDFVEREIARGELTIGEPPALPDVTAMRELLLREPVVWKRYHDLGGTDVSAARVAQLTVARALVASALAKARAQDPAAWEDLRAVWTLARSLDGQPQMMMQTAAFSMARMINAVAWKMPLPAPAWLGELQQRDAVRPLLESFQYSAASYWEGGAQMFPTKWLADSVEHDRGIATALFKETRCDVNAPMNDLGTNLSFVWRRAFRYRAEREATANALRVREGKPIETASRCSDGAWAFDGTTLRFSREIATAAPDQPMPLVLRVGHGERRSGHRSPGDLPKRSFADRVLRLHESNTFLHRYSRARRRSLRHTWRGLRRWSTRRRRAGVSARAVECGNASCRCWIAAAPAVAGAKDSGNWRCRTPHVTPSRDGNRARRSLRLTGRAGRTAWRRSRLLR